SHLGEVFTTAEIASVSGEPLSPETGSNHPRNDYTEQKVLRGEMRRMERAEQELVHKLERLEHAHQEIQQAMSLEENYTDPDAIRRLQRSLAENEQDQQETSTKWEETVHRLEELNAESP
ncbi:MAG: hypothetical protein WD492_16535, partial [Alkalispirochaeta sp.]